ncbi:MAG TPA: ATP-binding protein [Acidimicrobiales bacterium]|nr:ATP-binding protein [Acidimicrobiales bacterium]
METQDEVGDEVRLAVPATPEFLRLARVTASGLASRMGFTLDEVEDLRLAIDELCFVLIGNKGRAGTVDLRYAVNGDTLEVVGTGTFDDGRAAPVLASWSEQMLKALVDEYALFEDGGHTAFRMVKRRLPPPGGDRS